MDIQKMTTSALKKRLALLEAKVPDLFPLMRGCIVRIGMKSKQPTYSLNMKGKTKIVYLGESKEQTVRQMIDNYKTLLKLIDEMTLINIELVKKNVSEKSDKN
jgi:hypothetical protein